MPFYFENLAYFVPSTETKKINGFAPIHPRLVTKGLSKNYVATNVGMKSTRFSSLAKTLFSSESS